MEAFSTCVFEGELACDELSCVPGEKFKVISYYYEDDWSKVLNSQGHVGLIPRCALTLNKKDVKWLFPSISRTNAELYLKDKKSPIGSFVVRCSQTKDGFALSIKLSDDLIGHMYVNVDQRTGFVKLWQLRFKSLRQMVHYYKHNAIYNEIRLAEPNVPRRARSLYDFDAKGEWELSMKENNFISILTYVNRNWYLAVDDRQSQVGIVPRNYIELCLPEAAYAALPTLKSPGQSQLAKRRAVFRRDSTGLGGATPDKKTRIIDESMPDLISFVDDFTPAASTHL